MKKVFSLVSLLLLFSYSCKKDKNFSPVDLGYSYIPVNTGHWIIYDVDSIARDVFNNINITYHYQLKEYIESTFNDNSGRPTQRIERYKKTSDTTDWQICDVWTSNKTTMTYEKVEENIRFVKLTFPVRQGNQWNGNAYNEYPEQDYLYKNVNTHFSINGFSFDSTLTVLQQQDTTLISGDYAYEMYAKNVGMISKRFYTLSKTSIYGDTSQYIDYTYTIVSYGDITKK